MGNKKHADRLRQQAARSVEMESELGRAHQLLDTIEVPRVVSRGGEIDDQLYDRMIWMIHRGVQADALEALYQQRDLGQEAIDRLKKLATAYTNTNGPDPGNQTHPWLIVRWVKENLT